MYSGLIATLMVTTLIIMVSAKHVFAENGTTDCSCTSTSQTKGPGCVVGAYIKNDGCWEGAIYKKCEKGAEGSQSTCNCDTDECDDCNSADMCYSDCPTEII